MAPRSIAATIVALATSMSVVAQAPPPAERPGRPVSFVACPQFRDTARQCWLAEHGGRTYYIGAFRIGTAPQLLHRVLVEGVAHDGEMSCGAINIDPVHISPLPEIALDCDTVLPDNGTGPREGSIFDLPAAVLAQNGAGVPPPSPLHTDATWTVGYDFGSARLNLLSQTQVETIALAIMASPVSRVVVTGRQGRSHFSDGTVMTELPEIAAVRAAAVRKALLDIGVRPDLIEVLQMQPTVADGPLQDVASRNVTVEVKLTPSSQ
jgi:hypothetical protein